MCWPACAVCCPCWPRGPRWALVVPTATLRGSRAMALWRKDSPGQVSNQQTSTPGESLLWDLMPPTPQFPWLPLEAEGPGGPRPFHADAIWEQKLGAQAQAPRAWGKVSLIARSLTAPRAPTHCDALAGRQCRAGPRDYARTPCCVPWGCTAGQACPCPPRSWASQTRGQDSSRECGRSREPREPARGLQACAVCGGRAYELPSLRPAQRSALCSRQPDHLPPHSPPLHRGLCAQGGPRPQTGQSFAAIFVPGGVSSRQNPGGHPGGEAVRRSVGRLSKLLLLL